MTSSAIRFETMTNAAHSNDEEVVLRLSFDDSLDSIDRAMDFFRANPIRIFNKAKPIKHLLIDCPLAHTGRPPQWSSPKMWRLFELMGETACWTRLGEPGFLSQLRGIHLEDLGCTRFHIQLLSDFIYNSSADHSTMPPLPALEYLRVEYASLVGAPREWAIFGPMLEQCTALQSFQWQDVGFAPRLPGIMPPSSTYLRPVIEALSKLPEMKTIHIRALREESIGGLGSPHEPAWYQLCLSDRLTILSMENLEFDQNHIELLGRAMALRQREAAESESPNTNSLLEELRLSYIDNVNRDGISDYKGAFSIFAAALQNNGCMKEMALGFTCTCPVDDFLLAMANTTASMSRLRSLDIFGSDCPVSDPTVEAFVNMLDASNSDKLQCLQLSGYDGKWKPHVELYLKLNRRGIRRLLQPAEENTDDDNGDIHHDWADVLAQTTEDLECVYYFIRRSPLLFSRS